MYIKIDSQVKSKEVTLELSSHTFILKIRDEIIKKGEFYKEILPDECNWQFDEKVKKINNDISDGSDSSKEKQDNSIEKVIWLTILKKNETKGNQHWKCVLRGDDEIDLNSLGFGVPVHTFDSSMDKASLRKQMEQVRGYAK